MSTEGQEGFIMRFFSGLLPESRDERYEAFLKAYPRSKYFLTLFERDRHSEVRRRFDEALQWIAEAGEGDPLFSPGRVVRHIG
jgi:hypothetical protein